MEKYEIIYYQSNFDPKKEHVRINTVDNKEIIYKLSKISL
jgi:hypothetical protein